MLLTDARCNLSSASVDRSGTFYIATSEVSARVEVPVPVMVRLADMINGRRVLEGKTVSHGLFLSRAPGAKLTNMYSWRAS